MTPLLRGALTGVAVAVLGTTLAAAPAPPAHAGGSGAPARNDFSISVSPTSGSVNAGGATTTTVHTAIVSGSAETVALSASGLPAEVSASFDPPSAPAGGSATLTLRASSSASAGAYTITITGTAPSARHSTGYNLAVNGTGGCSGQKLGNPGFESGATVWSESPGVIGQYGTAGEPAHAGTWDAWLDGYGTAHTDTLSQPVTLPPGCTSYVFSFWLHIDTAETSTSTPYDTLKVQVLDTNGTVLATLVIYSNLNARSGYALVSLDIHQFAGATVILRFTGTEDSALQTSFVVDDTSVSVS